MNFHKVATKIYDNNQNLLLGLLKERHESSHRWLHNHILIFRDKFIVHPARPFQQGTESELATGVTRVTYFINPTWYGQEELDKIYEEVWKLNDSAPPEIKIDSKVIRNPNFVIGHLMEHVDELNDVDQVKLAAITKENRFCPTDFRSFSSPTVRVFGRNNCDI